MKNLILCQIIVVIVLFTAGVSEGSDPEYWPTWRGPNMMGISAEGNPPVKWSESENIKWKVKLTGDGSNSSPIIWKDKIIFQTAVDTNRKGKDAPKNEEGSKGGGRRGFGGKKPSNIFKFSVVCLDRKTGKLVWEKTVSEIHPHEGHHGDHGFASFSPVTDGKLIWANFGSRGLHCLDMDGNLKWSKELGKMNTVMSFGEGSSPVLAGDAVIVVVDHQGDSYIVAFNKDTGDLIWKKDRDEVTSWATPIPVKVNGKIQVVTSATNLIRSYDVKTGDIIWQCGGQTRNVIPSPVVGFGMIYCTSGFRGSALQAIELGRTGDLSNTDAIKWHTEEATPYVPSPLLYGDKLYVCSVNKGVISCYNAKTGKPYFLKEQLEEINGIYASPAGVAGRIYFVGRNGVTYVVNSSEKFEVLAVNKLDAKFDCSPAFAGNEIYLKGKEYLYCIASLK